MSNTKKKTIEKTNTLGIKNIIEGILLILLSSLVLIFDLEIGTLSLLYLFPIGLILLAGELLFISNKHKEIDTKRWVLILIEGLIYLVVTLYLVITKNINKDYFLVLVSSTLIFKVIFDFIIFNNRNIFDYIKYVLLVIVSILVIIFNKYVLSTLLIYLLIYYLVIGIYDIVRFIIKK